MNGTLLFSSQVLKMEQQDSISQDNKDITLSEVISLESRDSETHETETAQNIEQRTSNENSFQGVVAKTISELEFVLKEKDVEINKLTKLSGKYERLLEKANKYNDDLRHEVEKLSSELHIYRTARRCEMKSVCIQVTDLEIEDAYGNKPMPDWSANDGQIELSIAECLKAAAEAEVQNQLQDDTTYSQSEYQEIKPQVASGYVFDESSGLYYHSGTGFYWDPNSGLFYDYTSGTYYQHNETTGEYEVHSQVEVSGQTQISDCENQKIKNKRRKHRSRNKEEEANHNASRKLKKHLKASGSLENNNDVVSHENVDSSSSVLTSKQKTNVDFEDHIEEECREDKMLAAETSDKMLAAETSDKMLTDKTSDKMLTDETSDKMLTDKTSDKMLADETSDKMLTDETSDKMLTDETSDKMLTDETSDKMLAAETNDKMLTDKTSDKMLADEISDKILADKTSDKLLADETSDKLLADETSEHDSESSDSQTGSDSESSESGELTAKSSSSDVEMIEIEHPPVAYESTTEMVEEYPPCIRVIVQSSEHLKCGSLYIITCTGGFVGREKNKGLAIQIDDINVSKLHAEITFDYDEHCYTLKDKGSQNGTILNGVKLSQDKSESKLHHDDLLQIGSTTFLLHIHKGSETCDSCEPGQVQARIKAANTVKNVYPILSQEEKKRQRIRELKNIKRKYGLQNSYYETPGFVYTNPDYTDKAFVRRKLVGSDSELSKHNAEPVSVQRPISAQNKGHKLLAKMGWKEGEGLGKTSSGIAEPITVEMRINQTAGLGARANVAVSLDNVQHAQKAKRWSQARRRYEQLKDQNNAHTSASDHLLTVYDPVKGSQSPLSSISSKELNNSESCNPASCSSAESPSLSTLTFTNESMTISGVQPNLLKDSQHVIQAPAMQSQQGRPKVSWIRGDTEQIGQFVLQSNLSTSETDDT